MTLDLSAEKNATIALAGSATRRMKRERDWLLFGALLKRHTVFPLDDVPIKRKIDGETCCKNLATRRRLPKELKPRV